VIVTITSCENFCATVTVFEKKSTNSSQEIVFTVTVKSVSATRLLKYDILSDGEII